MTNDSSDRALPDPDSSNNPELNCFLPLDSEFDFACLMVLEGLKVDNIKPQKIASSSPIATVRSFSFSDPQNDIHLLPKELDEKVEYLLRNKQITSASRLKAISMVGTSVIGIQGSAEGVIACSDGENRRGSRSGRTFRVSSSSAGRPRHESSIEKNYLKSSSIEKYCLRSSSTWTSGVHPDKESLPNSNVLQPDWYNV